MPLNVGKLNGSFLRFFTRTHKTPVQARLCCGWYLVSPETQNAPVWAVCGCGLICYFVTCYSVRVVVAYVLPCLFFVELQQIIFVRNKLGIMFPFVS